MKFCTNEMVEMPHWIIFVKHQNALDDGMLMEVLLASNTAHSATFPT
jgi:hypothetical protein